jgi:AraC family transcriptional regulator of adaptative response/methylated-DNA-[protein]-cysteine methyltransferase
MHKETTTDYERIKDAIGFLEQNFRRQPDLKEIADHVGLSEYHFQRLFTRWAGISPKRFVQFLTIQHAKQLLDASKSLLDTTYDTGLSSPSRLHDLFVTHEAITPGEFKRKGAGLTITFGFHATPFGDCLLGMTKRGICHLAFVEPGTHERAFQEMVTGWPAALLEQNDRQTRPFAAQIFAPSVQNGGRSSLSLYVSGTNFQVRVWQALLRIPQGALVSYGTVAHMIGQPNAARAIGSAIGHNPIAYLIPCHRVIRNTGALGHYRWGSRRKKAMIGWEAAQFPINASS